MESDVEELLLLELAVEEAVTDCCPACVLPTFWVRFGCGVCPDDTPEIESIGSSPCSPAKKCFFPLLVFPLLLFPAGEDINSRCANGDRRARAALANSG
jgi:hypothetical protein